MITGIRPSDLYSVLHLIREKDLAVLSLVGGPHLVFSTADRQASWEHLLVTVAMTATSECMWCLQRSLSPVTPNQFSASRAVHRRQ